MESIVHEGGKYIESTIIEIRRGESLSHSSQKTKFGTELFKKTKFGEEDEEWQICNIQELPTGSFTSSFGGTKSDMPALLKIMDSEANVLFSLPLAYSLPLSKSSSSSDSSFNTASVFNVKSYIEQFIFPKLIDEFGRGDRSQFELAAKLRLIFVKKSDDPGNVVAAEALTDAKGATSDKLSAKICSAVAGLGIPFPHHFRKNADSRGVRASNTHGPRILHAIGSRFLK